MFLDVYKRQIPDTVKTIGVNAFKGAGLTAVRIPAGVTQIDVAAFYNGYTQSSTTYSNTLISVDATSASSLTNVGNTAFVGLAEKSIIYLPNSDKANLFEISTLQGGKRTYTTANTALAAVSYTHLIKWIV